MNVFNHLSSILAPKEFTIPKKEVRLTKTWYESEDLMSSNTLNVQVKYDPREREVVEDLDVWTTNRADNSKATIITGIAAEQVFADINGKKVSLFDFLVKAVDWQEKHSNRD